MKVGIFYRITFHICFWLNKNIIDRYNIRTLKSGNEAFKKNKWRTISYEECKLTAIIRNRCHSNELNWSNFHHENTPTFFAVFDCDLSDILSTVSLACGLVDCRRLQRKCASVCECFAYHVTRELLPQGELLLNLGPQIYRCWSASRLLHTGLWPPGRVGDAIRTTPSA